MVIKSFSSYYALGLTLLSASIHDPTMPLYHTTSLYSTLYMDRAVKCSVFTFKGLKINMLDNSALHISAVTTANLSLTSLNVKVITVTGPFRDEALEVIYCSSYSNTRGLRFEHKVVNLLGRTVGELMLACAHSALALTSSSSGYWVVPQCFRTTNCIMWLLLFEMWTVKAIISQ